MFVLLMYFMFLDSKCVQKLDWAQYISLHIYIINFLVNLMIEQIVLIIFSNKLQLKYI